MLATAILAALVPAPVDAGHVAGLPDCANTVPAAPTAQWTIGRVKTVGYAGGTIGAVNLRIVDQVSPSPVPDVFKPQQPPPVSQEFEVAGALVSLSFPGLQNQFLLGGPPSTTVAERAFPLTLSPAVTYSGAQTLSMLFNGRVTIYAPQSFSCGSVVSANTVWTFTIQKVAFDGYATQVTTLDDALFEPWGTSFEIAVGPGETKSW